MQEDALADEVVDEMDEIELGELDSIEEAQNLLEKLKKIDVEYHAETE